MHRLTPFTLDDFALLVDTAITRRFTKDDRHDLRLMDADTMDAAGMLLFWEHLDLMGGTDQ